MPKTYRKSSDTSDESVLRDGDTGLPLREVRLLVPDADHPEVQARLEAARAEMNAQVEADAIRWIEAVSMFDNEDRDLE